MPRTDQSMELTITTNKTIILEDGSETSYPITIIKGQNSSLNIMKEPSAIMFKFENESLADEIS